MLEFEAVVFGIALFTISASTKLCVLSLELWAAGATLVGGCPFAFSYKRRAEKHAPSWDSSIIVIIDPEVPTGKADVSSSFPRVFEVNLLTSEGKFFSSPSLSSTSSKMGSALKPPFLRLALYHCLYRSSPAFPTPLSPVWNTEKGCRAFHAMVWLHTSSSCPFWEVSSFTLLEKVLNSRWRLDMALPMPAERCAFLTSGNRPPTSPS